ncbi:MAG: TnpV protein [Lachnospiraceae bacterium]|nr:TnpV protein [Lachnospiraceae bacterium]
MTELKPRIHDDNNGLDYVLVGDYYIPDLKLPEERRPIGKWGRMHREYLKENRPLLYTDMVITGKLWTYLADLNEQAQIRLELIIEQMKAAEGVTEDLKRRDWWGWVQRMGNIQNRAEEIIRAEMIYN